MPRPQPTQSSGSVASDRRREQREMFALVLRSEPNKRGVPFSERTIGSYLDAVDSLAPQTPLLPAAITGAVTTKPAGSSPTARRGRFNVIAGEEASAT